MTGTRASPIERLDAAQQRTRGVRVVAAVVRKYVDDRAQRLAALMSWYGTLAVFPLLLLATTILGYVVDSHPKLAHDLLDTAVGQLPIIGDQLQKSVHPLQGSGVALLIGVLGALWGSLGVANAAQEDMAIIWGVDRPDLPRGVKQRLRSLMLIGVLGLGVIGGTLVAALPVLGVPVFARVLSPVLTLALNIALVQLAYRVITMPSVPSRALWPGSFFAGAAWYVLQSVGSLLVARQLHRATQTYGFFAYVLGLMFWVYLLCQVAVIGGEINAVLHLGLWPRSLRRPRPGHEPASGAETDGERDHVAP
jgi:YihY family inner membrane protein